MDAYAPNLGVAEWAINEHDAIFDVRKLGGVSFKAVVEREAKKVGLDPGLLAASMFAETTISVYRRKDSVDENEIGMDYYQEKIQRIEKTVHGARHIPIVGHPKNRIARSNELAHIVFESGSAAISGHAAYLKDAENEVSKQLSQKGVDLATLPIETRFALTRLKVNPGKMYEVCLNRAANGEDVLLRYGESTRNKHHPQRGATITAAQALHLSQAIFGTVLTN